MSETAVKKVTEEIDRHAVGYFRCDFCHRGQGSPCISKKGNTRKPHSCRMSAAMVECLEVRR